MELTQEIVRELLDYDPETGKLTWKVRNAKWFNSTKSRDAELTARMWNTKFSGKDALCGKRPDGYFGGSLLNVPCLAHRIIFVFMEGKFPNHVDHINGNGYDNRWINLRNVTNHENRKNTKRPENNTSGVVGVYWNNLRKYWTAQIANNGKVMNLGSSIIFEEAVKLRQVAEIKYGYHPNHGKR